MITDAEVFEDDHLPRRLKHRNGEQEALADALDPARYGRRANDVLISGPSGVGKTTLATYQVRDLDWRLGIGHAIIGCFGHTTAGILRALLEAHRDGPDHVAQTRSNDEVRAELRDVVDEPFVAVLDEADSLDAETLEVLTSIDKLSVVAICHDPTEWRARLGISEHHFSEEYHIRLDRYSVVELADILDERAQAGLEDDVVTRTHLETISDWAAGVARKGIQALRAAAELATERGHDAIHDTDIEAAYPRAMHRIRRANLESMGLHHKVLYAIVHEGTVANGVLPAGEMHDRYDDLAADAYYGWDQEPVTTDRARRGFLADLKEYELVDWDGEGRAREYYVCDVDVEPTLTLPTGTSGTVSSF